MGSAPSPHPLGDVPPCHSRHLPHPCHPSAAFRASQAARAGIPTGKGQIPSGRLRPHQHEADPFGSNRGGPDPTGHRSKSHCSRANPIEKQHFSLGWHPLGVEQPPMGSTTRLPDPPGRDAHPVPGPPGTCGVLQGCSQSSAGCGTALPECCGTPGAVPSPLHGSRGREVAAEGGVQHRRILPVPPGQEDTDDGGGRRPRGEATPHVPHHLPQPGPVPPAPRRPPSAQHQQQPRRQRPPPSFTPGAAPGTGRAARARCWDRRSFVSQQISGERSQGGSHRGSLGHLGHQQHRPPPPRPLHQRPQLPQLLRSLHPPQPPPQPPQAPWSPARSNAPPPPGPPPGPAAPQGAGPIATLIDGGVTARPTRVMCPPRGWWGGLRGHLGL